MKGCEFMTLTEKATLERLAELVKQLDCTRKIALLSYAEGIVAGQQIKSA
jgi:hypothetical protein